MHVRIALLLALCLPSFASQWAGDEMIGEKVPKAPTEATACEQSVGFYSEGELLRATQLLPSNGILKLFPKHHSNWANAELLDIVFRQSHSLQLKFPESERLQIGDISLQEGGPIRGHLSHQNGLDIDIAYLRIDKREQPIDAPWFDESFVEESQPTLNFDFDRNWWLFRNLVATRKINRIFVDQIIKSALCALHPSSTLTPLEAETLRRLRPYPGHHDHFHIRLQCPATSPRCIEQTEPDLGTGCPS